MASLTFAKKDVLLSLSNLLTTVRSDIGGKTFELTHKYGELNKKHSEHLRECMIKYEECKERCKVERLVPEDNLDLRNAMDEYKTALVSLNSDCMEEIADLSTTFLDAIYRAEGVFMNGIFNLAVLYQKEEHVDFDSIVEMFSQWYLDTSSANPPYVL